MEVRKCNRAREDAAPMMNCSRCNKRLSKKTARLIEGKPLCSACLFPKLNKGLP
jgi:formylmethanofuran dehydrogenase subunit E